MTDKLNSAETTNLSLSKRMKKNQVQVTTLATRQR